MRVVLAVLLADLARTARQPWTYWLRTVYVTVLATLVAFAWLHESGAPGAWLRQAAVGRALFESFAHGQMVLLVAATVLFLSNAIADERQRRTLPLVLAMPINRLSWVWGKLLGRLIPMVLLLAAGTPILFLLTLFGGLSPGEVGMALALTFVALLQAGAVTVLLSSILPRQEWVALFAGLIMLTLGCAPYPLMELGRVWGAPRVLLEWLWSACPLTTLAPWLAGLTEGDEWIALVAGCTIVVVLTILTALRVEGLCLEPRRERDLLAPLRHRTAPDQGARWWGNPLLARALGHRGAAGYRDRMLLVGGLAAAPSLAIALLVAGDPYWVVLYLRLLPILVVGAVVVAFLVGARGASEERGRGSLAVLLSTPMPSARLAWGFLAGGGVRCAASQLAVTVCALAGMLFGVIPVAGGLILIAGTAVFMLYWSVLGLLVGARDGRTGRAMLLSALLGMGIEAVLIAPLMLLCFRFDPLAGVRACWAYWAIVPWQRLLHPECPLRILAQAWLCILLHGLVTAGLGVLFYWRFDWITGRIAVHGHQDKEPRADGPPIG